MASGKTKSLLWAGLAILEVLQAVGAPPPDAGLRTLPTRLPATVSELPSTSRLPDATRLNLVISLPLRDAPALQNLVDAISDPANPNFRHYLSPSEFTARFGPTEEQYNQVKAFAQTNHLSVVGTHPNRLLLEVEATTGDAEKAFHVKLLMHRHPREARTFYSPDATPSVPAEIPVEDVEGLDNYVLPHPAGIHMTPPVSAGFNGSGTNGSYLASDIRRAYIPGVGLNGSGQKLALVEFDSYYPSDLAAYENTNQIGPVPVNTIVLPGAGTQVGSYNTEVIADIDMALAMAPGLDEIDLYQGGIGTPPSVLLSRIASDNAARQISSSWMFGFDTAVENVLMEMAVQGQTFFQASGDEGAYDWAMLGPHEGHPADSPFLTSVGGTDLATAGAGGDWKSESVWVRTPASGPIYSSGGGVSDLFALPPWQAGVDIAAVGGSKSMRNFPDVSMVADGIWFVANNGQPGVFWGTSAAAPLWAGLAALINQQAAQLGRPAVGFLNPTLYALGRSDKRSQCFHDIVRGNNTTSESPRKYYALAGYDLCTGWGTPRGENLIYALATRSFIQPACKITAPLAGARLTNGQITVTGTASSVNGISEVLLHLNTNPPAQAMSMNLWTNWATNLFLQQGQNTIRAFAVDTFSNVSEIAELRLDYIDVQPIVVIVNPPGAGVLKSGFRGTDLVVGSTYTIQAMPAAGNVFSNWTGTLNSAASTLRFVMQPNMVLQANFVKNPFLPAQGIYNGLFYASNGVAAETAGMLSGFKIGPRGTYTGKLLTGGQTLSLSGSFDLFGAASNYFARPANRGGPIIVQLRLNQSAEPPQLTGAVAGAAGDWTAELLALRAAPRPPSGEYTMLLAPSTNQIDDMPPGYGYATITNHSGTVTLIGALADGWSFNETVPTSPDGAFPFYAASSLRNELVLGWINFMNTASVTNLTWIKKPSVGIYANGFTNTLVAQLSAWTNPPPHQAAFPGTFQLSLSGDNLASNLTFTASFDSANKVHAVASPQGTATVTGVLNPKTGLVNLTLAAGSTSRTTKAQGIFLQDISFGAGFFLTPTNTGTMIFQEQ